MAKNEVKQQAQAPDRITVLENLVQDLCDYVFGKNVRPPAKVRTPDEYPAEVKPSNEDD